MGKMIPSNPSRIFRNRWWAMLWAAGVIWTAVTVVGVAPSHAHHPDKAKADATQSADKPDSDTQIHDITGAPVSKDEIKALAKLVG